MLNYINQECLRARIASACQLAALRRSTQGQDLIEYALMAGFVAVSAGSLMPGVANSISSIFSKIGSVMTKAAAQGS